MMCIEGNFILLKKLNLKFFISRKYIPPIPICKNKVLEHYNPPKLFEDFGFCGEEENEDLRTKMNHFNGWSFIKNTNTNK
jgi:hypothetical protein